METRVVPDHLDGRQWMLAQAKKYPALLRKATTKTLYSKVQEFTNILGVKMVARPMYVTAPLYRGLECGDGWRPAVERLFAKLDAIGWITVEQVKEKFGSLRVYFSVRTEGLVGFTEEEEEAFYADICSRAEAAVAEAVRECDNTCESCGATENVLLRGNVWLTTQCDACAIKCNSGGDTDD